MVAEEEEEHGEGGDYYQGKAGHGCLGEEGLGGGGPYGGGEGLEAQERVWFTRRYPDWEVRNEEM